MLKKHNKHGPLKWFAGVLAAASLLTALPVAAPVYAAGDTGSSTTVQTAYTGFSAVSDIKVNNVSVKRYGHYNLSFNGNGNTGGSMQNYTDAELDKQISLKNGFKKTGYTFVDWKDGAGKDYEQSVTATADTFGVGDSGTVILTAQWRPNTYTVHFNANLTDSNGKALATEGNMPDQKFTYDKTGVLRNNAFMDKTGTHQLAGWSLTKNGKVKYANMAQIIRNMTDDPDINKPDNDGHVIQLYGVWVEARNAADLTRENPQHTHIWVSAYDDNYHYEKCSLCGVIKGTETVDKDGNWTGAYQISDIKDEAWKKAHAHVFDHNGEGHWTLGDASNCSYSNIHVYQCSCGYEKETTEGRAEHQWTYIFGGWYHQKFCKVCGETDMTAHYHHDKDGNIIGPVTGKEGFCVECQSNITKNGMDWYLANPEYHFDTGKWTMTGQDNGDMANGDADPQWTDGNYIYDASSGVKGGVKLIDLKKSSIKMTPNADGTITLDSAIYVVPDFLTGDKWDKDIHNIDNMIADDLNPNKASYWYCWPDAGYGQDIKSVTDRKVWRDGKVIHSHCVVAVNPGIESQISFCMGHAYGKADDGAVTQARWFCEFNPDNLAPVLTSVTEKNEDVENGWARKGEITVKGTESYSHRVDLTLKNPAGTAVMTAEVVPDSDGNFTYTFDAPVEGTTGDKWTIEASDTFKNTSSKEFTVKNVDGHPPILTNPLNLRGQWHKSIDWTAKAEEYGSGGTKIGVNREDDMNSGTVTQDSSDKGIWYKKYTFFGDKYDDTPYKVFVKDAVGNLDSYDMDIGYLDGTAPTITKVDVSGNTVTVTATDMNAGVTDMDHPTGMEGSGVASFGYIDVSNGTKIVKIPDSSVTWDSSYKGTGKRASFDLPKNGSYLIVAYDKVGNTSNGEQVTLDSAQAKKASFDTTFVENFGD